MPVGVIPGETGDFETEHDAGAGIGHLPHQPLEAVPILDARSRPAQVAIDDMNALDRPAQGDGAVAQGVLALGALGVFHDLAQRRLSHVQKGIASEMVGGHFRQAFSKHG